MRNDILFGILITLLQKGKCTYQQLADKFEVSKRTIQRYCLNLEMSGIPTMCSYGRTGGIEIFGSYSLDNMFLTKPELQRLLTHLHASPLSKIDNIDRQIEEKLIFKTQSKQPATPSNILIDYKTWSEEEKLNPIIKLLNDNINLEQAYFMTYTDADGKLSTRTISPYKLIFKESKWYLFCYCHTKKSPRIFKVNRIHELAPSEEKYVRLKFSDAEIIDHINNFFEQITLTIETSEQALPDILEWLDESSITYNKNGSTIITGTATSNKELISKIISNSTKFKLLEPENLLNKVKETAKNLYNLYL